MAATDTDLAHALIDDAATLLMSDNPGNFSREGDLERVKRSVLLARTLLSGGATDEDRAKVAEMVHPTVRTRFGL